MTVDELGVRLQYTPHKPEPPQHAFLWLNRLEALYGGAAGGGKTDALLMAALQYVDVPRYHALLLRRTYPELEGTLLLRAHEWLGDTDAQWNGNLYRYTWPESGAMLTFGYLQTERHRYRYSGWEFQFVGFDEVTAFSEADYRFLFSRLRKPDVETGEPLAHVPLRMRGASNPGDRGHEWVRRRFIERRAASEFPIDDPRFDPKDTPARARRRVFIPARLDDNPHVDRESYEESLANLTVIERARLRDGDWYADAGDRYYPGGGVDAALALGGELDYLAERGQAPPPAGGLLVLGIDWGDRTWLVVLWPLERGGLWVIHAEPIRGREPGEATDRMLAALGGIPAWRGLGRVREPLELVAYVAYDAAGLQSQRTFTKRARLRRRNLRVVKVPFGNYKRATGLYLRSLLERAEAGHETRILAISPGLHLFASQLRNLRRDPDDEELPLKPTGDVDDEERDDGPDALIAAAARIAKANRGKL